MPVTIVGNNTPTAGGVVYGDGTNYASTAAGTSGQPIVSGGSGAPTFRPYTLPAADGTANQVLQTNGSGALSFATISAGFTLATPVATTSGTTVEFTGIPATVKQVVINFNSVGTNTVTTSRFQMELGTSSAYVTSSYLSVGMRINTLNANASTSTTYFALTNGANTDSSDRYSGTIIISLLDSTNNIWSLQGTLGSTSNTFVQISSGKSALSAALNKLKIYDSSGATFTAGSINIMYI